MSHHYRSQTKFVEVLFSQVSVCPRGGGGDMVGVCVAEGMNGRGCAWQGGLHVWWGRDVHGGGACMAGGMCGRGNV